MNNINVEQSVDIHIRSPNPDQNLSLLIPDRRLTSTVNPNLSIIDNLRAEASKLTKKLHLNDPARPITRLKSFSSLQTFVVAPSQIAYEQIFTDIEFSISVRPDIAGMNIPRGVFEHHEQVTTITGQVGQKFSSMSDDASGDDENGARDLYNFTKLPVNSEDLVELLRSTVSTIVSPPSDLPIVISMVDCADYV